MLDINTRVVALTSYYFSLFLPSDIVNVDWKSNNLVKGENPLIYQYISIAL